MTDNRLIAALETFKSYFALNQYLVPQQQAEESIREGVSFRGMNLMILITAIFIASLGLNTNSPAVIIGAMLISPLMGPILGVGLGVGVYDFELIKRSLRNLAMAAGFSVLTATVYFLISPVSEGHSELLARTSPSIYDVLIGFFGGAAGILALGSKSKGNVIPGVAIATALMPPLCTAGYGLATWQLNYFFGAFYLFLINSIYIAIATFIGVKLMKYKPDRRINTARSRKLRRWVVVLAVVTLLPSIYLTWQMLRQNSFRMKASKFVSEEFRFPGTQVIATKAHTADGQREIDVTLIGRVLPTDSLELAMTNRLRFYGLEGVRLNILQGAAAGFAAQSANTSADDIYRLAQATIAGQQQTIDSLRSALALRNAADSAGATIAPELKVLFPKVRDIAITRPVFGSVESGRLDSVNVAMVNVSPAMGDDERDKFVSYLRARLKLRNVSVVDVGSAVSFPPASNKTSPAKKTDNP